MKIASRWSIFLIESLSHTASSGVLAIYVISPTDLCTGPIDDVLAILVWFAANRNTVGIERKGTDTDIIDVDI